MAGTCMPAASSCELSASVGPSAPTTSGTMGLSAGTPSPWPSRSTSDHTCARRQDSLGEGESGQGWVGGQFVCVGGVDCGGGGGIGG